MERLGRTKVHHSGATTPLLLWTHKHADTHTEAKDTTAVGVRGLMCVCVCVCVCVCCRSPWASVHTCWRSCRAGSCSRAWGPPVWGWSLCWAACTCKHHEHTTAFNFLGKIQSFTTKTTWAFISWFWKLATGIFSYLASAALVMLDH